LIISWSQNTPIGVIKCARNGGIVGLSKKAWTTSKLDDTSHFSKGSQVWFWNYDIDLVYLRWQFVKLDRYKQPHQFRKFLFWTSIFVLFNCVLPTVHANMEWEKGKSIDNDNNLFYYHLDTILRGFTSN